MQRNTETSPARADYVAPAGQARSDDTSLRALTTQLRQIGFEVPSQYGNVAGGVPLRLPVRTLLQSAAGAGPAINAIRALLRDNTPFTLALSDLGCGDAAIHATQRFCELLQAEIANTGRSGEHVGICIQSAQMPLQAFRLIADSVPGAGPRYVILDSSQMTAQRDQRSQSATDTNWSFLWRNRISARAFQPAYGATVRTACPLLADELATAILPAGGIQVPPDSAWLPVSIALPRFADDAGEIRWEQLLRALACGVELVDKCMDRLHWPHAAQQSDARLNRRLAISITGLGDLVLRRGLDPQDLDALRWLSAIVMRVRKKLWHHSGEMAQKLGCLPALSRSEPSSGWTNAAQHETWRQHWRVALEKSAVRHRNMLVISPYAVLPSVQYCDAAYTDLLPVIACADAWSFANAPKACSWNLSEYKSFHRRACAIIHGCKTGTLVAAGV